MRPEPGADQPALLARPGRVLDELVGLREALAHHRQQLGGVAAGAAVHGGQHRDLGVVALAAERPGQRRVEVDLAGRAWPAPRRRPSRPAPAAPAGRRRRRRASSRRRPPPRAASPWGSAAPRRRWWPSARTPRRPPRTRARKRPSRTHWSAQVQPWKLYSRASSLYASSGPTAGWSICLSSQDRVVFSATPALLNALTSCCTESGLTGWPNAADTSSASACSLAGRMPCTGRGPSSSVSRASCTSARHGMPSWPISAAISAPADSAATSSRNRPGSGSASIRRSWSASTSATASAPQRLGREQRAGLVGPLVRHGQAVQPGVGGPGRAGLAVAALVGEQQALGEREVVAARHPHAGAQQARVALAGVGPHPPRPRGLVGRAPPPPGRRPAAAVPPTGQDRLPRQDRPYPRQRPDCQVTTTNPSDRSAPRPRAGGSSSCCRQPVAAKQRTVSRSGVTDRCRNCLKNGGVSQSDSSDR